MNRGFARRTIYIAAACRRSSRTGVPDDVQKPPRRGRRVGRGAHRRDDGHPVGAGPDDLVLPEAQGTLLDELVARARLRDRIYEKIQRSSFTFHVRQRSGDLFALSSTDTRAIEQSLFHEPFDADEQRAAGKRGVTAVRRISRRRAGWSHGKHLPPRLLRPRQEIDETIRLLPKVAAVV